MKTSNTFLTAAMLTLVFSSSAFANIPDARNGAWMDQDERSENSGEVRDDDSVMMLSESDDQHAFERSGR